MGRAINMQKDIDAIKIELERLNNKNLPKLKLIYQL